MNYTQEERAAMHNAADQVKEWLKSRQSEIRETIRVPFGAMVTRRGNYGCPVRQREYELVLGTRWIGGWSGGLRYTFEREPENPSYEVSVYSYGFGASFMAALMADWPEIKREILSEIAEQSAKASALKSFRL